MLCGTMPPDEYHFQMLCSAMPPDGCHSWLLLGIILKDEKLYHHHDGFELSRLASVPLAGTLVFCNLVFYV